MKKMFLTVLMAALMIQVQFSTPASAKTAKQIIRTTAFRCDGAHGSESVWSGKNDMATIFCIHDLSLCSQAYKKFALGLRSKAHQTAVYAVDIRDLGVHQSLHGMREWLDLRISSKQLAETLTAYRAKTKEPLYLMGEGLGASLALDIVLKNPHLVDGLILSNMPETFYKQRSAILKSGFGYVFRPFKRVAVGARDSKPAQSQEFMPTESLGLVHFVDDIAQRAKRSKPAIPLLYLQGNDPYGQLQFSLAVFKQLAADGEFVLSPGGHLIAEVAPDSDLIDTVYLWLEGRRPKLVVLAPPDKRKAAVERALKH